jgi:hypothetical protein
MLSSLGVLLLVAQALVANANPAPIHVELVKRTCLKRRSPDDPRLVGRNDIICSTTITTCPVTPTVTTTSTTTTTQTDTATKTETTTKTDTATKTDTITKTDTKTETTTTCPPVTTPPPGKCDIGTAMGKANCCSTELDDEGICTRWGWYITATPSTTFPITGDLWVGAGLNDVSKATKVGTFTITRTGTGPYTYTVTYMFSAGYSAAEVHIYAGCTKPTDCAFGKYPYSSSPASATLSCSTAYFVLHAKVNQANPAGGTCPTPSV